MTNIYKAKNEPIRDYRPKSKQRISIQAKYDELSKNIYEIPLIIDGTKIKTGIKENCIMPHDHNHILANYHNATKTEVRQAIECSLDAWKSWSERPFKIRKNIFLKAAELLRGRRMPQSA